AAGTARPQAARDRRAERTVVGRHASPRRRQAPSNRAPPKQTAVATAGRRPSMSAGGGDSLVSRAGTPDVDAGEQEQPHHLDEMPVPGAELEAEMLLGREVAEIGADQAHDQEG